MICSCCIIRKLLFRFWLIFASRERCRLVLDRVCSSRDAFWQMPSHKQTTGKYREFFLAILDPFDYAMSFEVVTVDKDIIQA